MKKRWIIFLLIGNLLTGCMVGPRYRRPAVSPPDVFRGSTNLTSPTDPTSLADLKWFEVFKDEQLQELIREALAYNYDLREAVARVDIARANLGITKSDQYPKIGGSGDLVTERRSRDGSLDLPEPVKQHHTF